MTFFELENRKDNPMTQAIPNDMRSLTPHLIVKDAAAAIEFYKSAFGAIEQCCMKIHGSEKIMHAQIQIGDSKLMLAEEFPDCGGKSPLSLGGSPVTLHHYVENVDEAFQKALKAGAQETMPVQDMFWGDRYGKLKDPFGHEWALATHVKDMTPEETMKAAEECFKQPVGS